MTLDENLTWKNHIEVISGKKKVSSGIGAIKRVRGLISEMNITGTLPQVGNLKIFVPSLSTQSSTRPKQNIFNVVLIRPDKTE